MFRIVSKEKLPKAKHFIITNYKFPFVFSKSCWHQYKQVISSYSRFLFFCWNLFISHGDTCLALHYTDLTALFQHTHVALPLFRPSVGFVSHYGGLITRTCIRDTD